VEERGAGKRKFYYISSLHRRAFSTLELMIVLVIIGVLLMVAAGYYQEVINRARREVLAAELRNMRLVLQLYRALYRRYPDDIRLLEKVGVVRFYQPERPLQEKYLKFLSIDAEGYPLDPFGRRYFYGPETGEIRSRTPGFESW